MVSVSRASLQLATRAMSSLPPAPLSYAPLPWLVDDSPSARTSLQSAVVAVLMTPHAGDKMAALRALLADGPPPSSHRQRSAPPLFLPSHPPLPATPPLVSPTAMTRPPHVPVNVFMAHQLAHVEYWAVNLYLDTAARHATNVRTPTALLADCLQIAGDEATHFGWLEARLRALGWHYGALPAHDGLWRDAVVTADSLEARLCVLPLVQEARALDSEARLVHKLRSAGDAETAEVVGRICGEEVRHVAVGVRWFTWLCAQEGHADPSARFHELVRRYVRSPLPPPFNAAWRAAAGMSPEWYMPVSRGAAREAAGARASGST